MSQEEPLAALLGGGMSSLLDKLRSIVDGWAIETGRYTGNRPRNQGVLSTQAKKAGR
jgi:hypothetical protein